MSDQIKTLESIISNQPTPHAQRAPGEHAYTTIVRNYLNEIKVDLDKSEVEDETSIQWSFSTDPGVSVFFRIYRTGEEMFLHFEVALAQLDAFSEANVLRWISSANSQFHYPLRLAVAEPNLVIAQFRVYCDGITPDHCKLRVETLLPFSLEMQEQLRRQFGLLPAIVVRPKFDK